MLGRINEAMETQSTTIYISIQFGSNTQAEGGSNAFEFWIKIELLAKSERWDNWKCTLKKGTKRQKKIRMHNHDADSL